MGKKKYSNPFLTRRQQVAPAQTRIMLESNMAMAEYKQREYTRRMIASDDELKREYYNRDGWMESWMYGCMAVVLHRRYRFTAPKLVEIINEIQAFHEEVLHDHPECETYEEVNRIIAERVEQECGMKVFDDNYGR